MEPRESGRSIRRFVELLELFEQRQCPLASAEIADALEAPRSSTSALLRSLVDLGMLIFDRRSATYLPSTHLADLTSWVVRSWMPDSMFLDRLAALSRETEETVSLWTAADLQMEVLHVIDGSTPLTLRLRPGQRFSILFSAVGTAYLMSLPRASRGTLLRRLDHHARERGKAPDMEGFRKMILTACRRGYAMAEGAHVPDVLSIAVPVPGNPPRPLVVSIGGLASRMRPREAAIARSLKKISIG